jgi:hypothetical protein
MCYFEQNVLCQHVPDYQPLRRYKHSNECTSP